MSSITVSKNYLWKIMKVSFRIFSKYSIKLKKIKKDYYSGEYYISENKSIPLKIIIHKINLKDYPLCDAILKDNSYNTYIDKPNNLKQKEINGKKGYYSYDNHILIFDTIFLKSKFEAYTLTFILESKIFNEIELIDIISQIIENTYAHSVLQTFFYKRKIFFIFIFVILLFINKHNYTLYIDSIILLILYGLCYLSQSSVLFNQKNMMIRKSILSKYRKIDYKDIQYVIVNDYDNGRDEYNDIGLYDMQSVATKYKQIFLKNYKRLIKYDAHMFLLDHPSLYAFETTLSSHGIPFISKAKWKKRRNHEKQ